MSEQTIYRLLNVGERMLATDEIYSSMQWVAVGQDWDGDLVLKRFLPIRRPDPAPVGVRVPDGIRRFVKSLIDKPFHGNDPEVIYAIHTGTEYAAELRMSDLVALLNPQPGAVVGDVVPASAMRDLYRAYVNLLETGRDRIKDLGGECDSVEDMERSDPFLIQARRTLTNTDKGVV